MVRRKILVIVDMQNDFTIGCLGNTACEETIEVVKEILKREEYDEYIFTQDTHTENYLETVEGKNLPVEHCKVGTVGIEIVDGLLDIVKDKEVKIFSKNTFGSILLADYFRNFRMDTMGREMQIDFVGVCTGICVISNVLLTKAILPEAKIRVIEKATACVTPESKKTALNAMELCHIEVV